jgi:integrase
VAEPVVEPGPATFHAYSEQWWTRNVGRWQSATVSDYKWRIEVHLLPYFGEMRLDRIGVAEVESYIAAKLAGGLGARSINMTVATLATIMESAVERDLIARNPARGRNRRVRERRPARSCVTAATQVEALLAAAGSLDAEASRYAHVERRCMVAVLLLAGLRISEALDLRWRDVDLASGRLTVEQGKTAAASRAIRMRGLLHGEMRAVRARRPDAAPDDRVFATSTGNRIGESNFRRRVLTPAVERANGILDAQGRPRIGALTPHSLRRSYASVECALGTDVRSVMAAMGHSSPQMTLGVYARSLDLTDRERDALRRLVDGDELVAVRGSWSTEIGDEPLAADAA